MTSFRFALLGLTGFGNAVYRKLKDQGLSPSCVITRRENSSFPFYKERDFFEEMKEEDIPCFLEDEGEAYALSQGLDAIVVATYHRILEKNFYQSFPMALKVHPSILPLYRGPNPFYWPIVDGKRETGITIHELGEQIDNGRIYWQKTLSILENETQGSLRMRLADLSAEGICELVRRANEQQLEPIAEAPEISENAFWARSVSDTDRIINLSSSREELTLKLNALSPFPGAILKDNEENPDPGVESEGPMRFNSLTGKVIKLRPVQKQDVKTAVRWRNVPEIRDSQMGFRFPVTEEMEEIWNHRARNYMPNIMICSIDDLSDGVHVGFVQLSEIDWISRTALFGITIGEIDRHGRGLGTEASQLIFDYAFSVLNLDRIWLQVPSFNEKAMKIYRKCGFKEEGRLRNQLSLNNAKYDVLIFGLMRTEFLKSKK